MNWIAAIGILAALIVVHELGHYLMARLANAAISDFSVGFGPVLLSYHDSRGTRWGISALPLGGYVRMVSESEDPDRHIRGERYEHLGVGARALIAVAGPLANLLLGWVLLCAVELMAPDQLRAVLGPVPTDSPAALAGIREGDEVLEVNGDSVRHYGDLRFIVTLLDSETSTQMRLRHQDGTQSTYTLAPVEGKPENRMQLLGLTLPVLQIPPVLQRVEAGSPAERAGLLAGDRMVSFNGTPMENWADWVPVIAQHPGEQAALVVERGGELRVVNVTLDAVSGAQGERTGRLGVHVQNVPWPKEMLVPNQLNFFTALGVGAEGTIKMIVLIVDGFVQLFTGKLGMEDLGGPIAIVNIGAQAVDTGIRSGLIFAAAISISLMLINLVPLPGLDGGSLVLQGLEALKGRALSMRFRVIWGLSGLVVIGSLLLFVVGNDLLRLLW